LPKNGLFAHVSGLGPIARLDFERYDVAGEVTFKVEGDAFPTSQEDEEARIGSLAYAIRKLSNEVDAAKFVRCLNAICEDGDARGRQTIASHYYREISERGACAALKEMALFVMRLQEPAVIENEEEDNEKWVDRDGAERTSTVLVASSFEFLPSKKSGEAMADDKAGAKSGIPPIPEEEEEPVPF
jgi:hypothetical protein